GVLHAEVEYNDSGWVTSICLSETGDGARSQISLGDISLEEQVGRPLASAAGWRWHIVPIYQFSWNRYASLGVSIRAERGEDGLEIFLAHTNTNEDYGFRPVAFDAEMNRYDFNFEEGLGSYDVALDKFTLAKGVIAHDSIVRFGVEKRRVVEIDDGIASEVMDPAATAGQQQDGRLRVVVR
ncbi:MAG: hypothetical protein GY869_06795, partial [Planctomycetes bacterium]|nr:hypothetical protein [Planctomycetota bacterium]